jgi:hypothetical protein
MNAKELNFAYRVRHALSENLNHLPPSTTDRLAAARQIALSHKKKDASIRAFALQRAAAGHAGKFFNDQFSWLRRFSLLIPIFFVVIGLGSLSNLEIQQRISDTADIDAAVLADELPLDAYLDNGFNAFLAKRAD